MTRYELAKRYSSLLYQLSVYGIEVKDWENVKIYEDIIRMRSVGEKMEYCVYTIARKYSISEARVWRIIRKMRTNVNP